MDEFKDAITYVFLIIGMMMIIFAVLQLSVRGKTKVNYSLSFLFLCLGYIWLYYGFYRADRFSRAPWLLYSDVVVTFLAGPVLLSYATNLAGYPRRSVLRRVCPYLPGIAALVFLIAGRPAARVSTALLPSANPDHFAIPAVHLLNTFGDIHFFFHVLASTIVIARLRASKNSSFRKAFRGVLRYFTNSLWTFILFFAGHVLHSDNLLGLAVLLNGINSAYFFFLSYRYPEYTQRSVGVPERGARKPPSLRGVDVEGVLARLGRAIEGEGGFRDPDLTLQSISERLGIQYHQLSQILNVYMGTNFRSYVNRRRVSEAKRLLIENPEMPILDIAYESGFNSKSAFNSAFIREMGLSPSDFRKNSSAVPIS